ncbi:hypothetical protein CXB45_04045 [Corynebacterium mastitidis]|uniref:Uncharacterized protein n=1 Tax=Corynebacterium mastitidis TaxID=161890 RepID=A0A2N0X8H9_9CORY|nr:hypothetical protein CXB45_04045 [Corynebacterium mastitidis]
MNGGWSEEHLNAARSGWGPGVIEVLPDNLAARLSAQTEAEGRSTLDLISEAVEKLFADRPPHKTVARLTRKMRRHQYQERLALD